MRRWVDYWTEPAPLSWWFLMTFLVGVLVGVLAGQASAAPLSVHGRQANLYGGRLGMARVCADLHLNRPQTARFSVQGARQYSTYSPDHDGSWAQHKTVRLKPGHRRFCLSFTVRYWHLTTAVKLSWRAEVFNAVHAELTVGDRTYTADRLLAGQAGFPAVTP